MTRTAWLSRDGRAAFDLLPDAVVATDAQTRILCWNRAAETLYGVGAERVVGRALGDVLRVEGGPPGLDRVLEEAARTGQWRGDLDLAVGPRRLRVGWAVSAPGTGGPARGGWVAVGRDAGAAPGDGTTLREDHQLFTSILDSIGEAVFVRGEDLALEYCNPAFERITGYPPESIETLEGAIAQIHPEDRPAFLEAIRRFSEGELEEFDVEGRFLHADGGVRWFRNRAVWAATGRRKLINLLEDVSRRKQAESELRQAHADLEAKVRERTAELEAAKRQLEADIAARTRAEEENRRLAEELRRSQTLEAVGRLAGGVAHDFNNLLGSVVACLYAARMHAHGNRALQDELDQAQQLCKRGGEVTRQLLTVARRRTGRKEAIPTAGWLEETRTLLARTLPKHVELGCRFGPDLPPLRGDRSLLSAALLNLALNAKDAMPRGGTLTLAARRVALGPHRAGVEIQVADTGCGIPPDLHDKVFEPFFTTKAPEDGSGMGLAMVYACVTECGGEISLRSAPGEGSTFTLTLPAEERTSARLPGLSAVRPGRHPLVTGPVLVVEDEDDVARMITDVLQRHGYATLRAATGVEALEALGGHRAAIDLVALDLMLPELEGAEVYRVLRTLAPDLPVLFITGRQDLARRLDPGAPVLPKPFGDRELLAAIEAVFRPAAAGGGGG